MKSKYCILLLTLLAWTPYISADSIEVSILTCEPGEAVYELYGHTAIRVREMRLGGRDAVFNYGVFDFNAPGFVWRFVKGETDYEVWSIPYHYFHEEYMREHRRVWQQTLALDSLQKADMADMLWVNCRPENRKYRYNYLYDNCTTRCRDMIEAVATVAWPEAEPKTYREIIHEFAGSPFYSWDALGQDLLLGWAVDTLIGVRQQMFSPIYFMRFLDKAQTHGKPLVSDTRLIVNPNAPGQSETVAGMPTFTPAKKHVLPPMGALSLWATIAMILSLPRVYRTKWGRWCFRLWYALLAIIVTAMAAIIDMLYFFSSHPAVDTNNLIWLFNPLALFLILAPLLPRRHKKR